MDNYKVPLPFLVGILLLCSTSSCRYLLQRLFYLVGIILLISPVYSQDISFDFENAPDTPGYITDTLTIGDHDWFFVDALIGTREEDKKNGTRSVRVRNGSITMLFDVPGTGFLHYLASNSGFAADGGGIIQVYYSTDQGSTWEMAGDEAVLGNEPDEFSVLINSAAPVRFRWEKTAGNRINIDDIRVGEYFDIKPEPVLSVSRNSVKLEPGDRTGMPVTVANNPVELELNITNLGSENLEIDSVGIDSDLFSILPADHGNGDGPVTFPAIAIGDTAGFIIRFESDVAASYETLLTIRSNDPENPEYQITITADVVSQESVIPISLARQLPLGTRVTVGGRITVGSEFNGPVFFQDNTGGLAASHSPLTQAVMPGDSVTVNGPLTEFNPFGGSTPGFFLRQIAPRGEDAEISFEIIPGPSHIPDPVLLTLDELRNGDFEAQLVTVNNVAVARTGVFGSNQNTGISDGTSTLTLRIDGNTDIPGDSIRSGPVSITGVADRVSSAIQLKPRSVTDITQTGYPGDDLGRNKTFDIVTWNIEWFGSSSNGPSNVELQYQNVLRLIRRVDADVYAFQEISNPEQFQRLIDDLDEYRGFLAGFTQTQKTGYLFRFDVVDSLSSGLISAGMNSFDWAGRLPLLFRFSIETGDGPKIINAINFHAKCCTATVSDYDRRVNASAQLKTYTDGQLSQQKIIILGDYNDDVTVSNWQGDVSPYQDFVEDPRYRVLTRTLSETGFSSFRFSSMIDHITISEPLFEYHLEGSQQVENPSYIAGYLNTTSDHFPVRTRFYFGTGVSVPQEDPELPLAFSVGPNYPNPFNPSTTLRFSLPDAADVTITVYDITGRQVATVLDGASYHSGTHSVLFDAGRLSSGMYIYRVTLSNGHSKSGKMLLLK